MTTLRSIATAFLLVGSALRAWGMDPEVRRLISPDTALLVEFNHPLKALDSQFLRDLWKINLDAPSTKQALASPEYEKLRQLGRLVEKSLETDWKSGFSRLTEGGVVLAVHPGPESEEPDVTAIVSSADEPTLHKFLDAVYAEIKRKPDAPEAAPAGAKRAEAKPKEVTSTQYKTFTCYRVGNGHFAVLGRRLLASNRQSRLEAALDRVSGNAPTLEVPESVQLTEVDGREPLLSATLNLKLLRERIPEFAASGFPHVEPAFAFLLGGYVDLLQRSDFAAAAVFLGDASAELRIRLPAGSDGTFPGIQGYFASTPENSAARLLTPPETLFSTSSFRDFAKLWDQRQTLFAAEVAKQLEDASGQQAEQGIGLSLVDAARHFGPRYRIVAALPRESVYKFTPEERLPSFAAVIELRDEAQFREKVLSRIDQLLAAVLLPQGIQITPIEHRGARLLSVRLPDIDQPPAELPQRFLYNLNPAYGVVRGHFIVGSTAEIVRDLIDELERPVEAPTAASVVITNEQRLEFAPVAELLRTFRPWLRDEVAREHEFSADDANKELEIFGLTLQRLGTLSLQSIVGKQQFDIQIRIGATGTSATPAVPSLARPRQ